MKKLLFISTLVLSYNIGCNTSFNPSEIDHLVDAWHVAAASADEETFFGSMSEDCIYLGTDISERWKRDELKSWSAKYFNRESAWDFSPYERVVQIDKKGDIAWWDEKLNTWMGKCRGSGIAKRINGEWKIVHYHLSVAVPNEKIKEFIELVEGKSVE